MGWRRTWNWSLGDGGSGAVPSQRVDLSAVRTPFGPRARRGETAGVPCVGTNGVEPCAPGWGGWIVDVE